MNGQSNRTIGTAAGVDHTSIADLLAGRTWSDTRLIAILEHTLKVSIWPKRTGHPK